MTYHIYAIRYVIFESEPLYGEVYDILTVLSFTVTVIAVIFPLVFAFCSIPLLVRAAQKLCVPIPLPIHTFPHTPVTIEPEGSVIVVDLVAPTKFPSRYWIEHTKNTKKFWQKS